MIRLIALLGNPGREYAATRHNAAWLLAERLSFGSSLAWQEKFKGFYASFRDAGRLVYLLKPDTYMNLSGEAVQKLLAFFKIGTDELLVVHDEIELPFGTVSMRLGGGLGGHNGLKSVASSLGTRDFYRFRIGVSRPKHGDVASYVLSRFSGEEEPLLDDYLRRAASLVEEALKKDPAKAAASYGKTELVPFS